MIRLFLYAFFRLIIIGLAVYVGLTVLRWIIRLLQGQSHPLNKNSNTKEQVKHKEDYKDVQDAKFEEITDKEKGEKYQ